MYIKYFYAEYCNNKTWGLDDDFEGKPVNMSKIKQSFLEINVVE